MDKYGVQQDIEFAKTAKEQTSSSCPECGGKVQLKGSVCWCPSCGTKPFERADGNKERSNTNPSSTIKEG